MGGLHRIAIKFLKIQRVYVIKYGNWHVVRGSLGGGFLSTIHID